MSSGIFKFSSRLILSATIFSLRIYPSYLILISADSAISLKRFELNAFSSVPPFINFNNAPISTWGRAAIVIAFTFCEIVLVSAFVRKSFISSGPTLVLLKNLLSPLYEFPFLQSLISCPFSQYPFQMLFLLILSSALSCLSNILYSALEVNIL